MRLQEIGQCDPRIFRFGYKDEWMMTNTDDEWMMTNTDVLVASLPDTDTQLLVNTYNTE